MHSGGCSLSRMAQSYPGANDATRSAVPQTLQTLFPLAKLRATWGQRNAWRVTCVHRTSSLISMPSICLLWTSSNRSAYIESINLCVPLPTSLYSTALCFNWSFDLGNQTSHMLQTMVCEKNTTAPYTEDNTDCPRNPARHTIQNTSKWERRLKGVTLWTLPRVTRTSPPRRLLSMHPATTKN
jgi:hypothetical protein